MALRLDCLICEERSRHCVLVLIQRYALLRGKQIVSLEWWREFVPIREFMSKNVSHVQNIEEGRTILIEHNVAQILLRFYQRCELTVPPWELLVLSSHSRDLIRQQRVGRRDDFLRAGSG